MHVYAETILRRVADVCDAHRIEILPVKGVLTAHLLYEDVAERPITDVDVRVRPRDLERLVVAGQRAGWKLLQNSRPYRNVVFDLDGRTVDIEATVGPPGLCGLSVDDMLARSTESVAPFGFRHRQPEIHDHALVLCVNAFKDKFVFAHPGSIRDLTLIAEQREFDPARLVALARECGVNSILWIVADWLAGRPGNERWRAVRALVGARPPRAVYTWLFARALERARPESLPIRIVARAGADSPRRQLDALVFMAWWVLDSLRTA